MYVYGRLIKLLLGARGAPQSAILDPSVLHFRVWPNDLDFNFHMNNGRYLTLMDLGRMDLVARAGLLPLMRANKWYPVLGNCMIRFRRPLQPFEKFKLTTRIIGWDEKWVYLVQRFDNAKGQPAALALVRGLFGSPAGSVPPPQVMQALKDRTPSPDLPEWVKNWGESDEALWRSYAES